MGEHWTAAKERFMCMTVAEKRRGYHCGDNYLEYNATNFPNAYKPANQKIPGDKIAVWRGDITTLEFDAIVNAANEKLLRGGGVCGAIHQAAGLALQQECREAYPQGCPTGGAKITGGYRLPAKYVIHAVGPRDRHQAKLVECYNSILNLVEERALRTVAIPCISTGIFGYPSADAARVALGVVYEWLTNHPQFNGVILFCVFSQSDYDLYCTLSQQIFTDTKMSEKKWPGYTGQCNPQVWNEEAKPPQPEEKKVGQLTEEQIDEYFREGVVLIEDYFSPDELEPVKDSIGQLVDYLADRLYAEGKLKSKYEEFGFFQRLTKINNDYKGANIILNKLDILPQSIRDLWSGEKLCNAAEQLIGPDIGGHPVWNLRTKVPQDEATTVPWHQDSAYLDTSSYDKHQLCAWIPLLDATEANGCMEFAMRGHKKGKIAMHQCCDRDTHYVMLEHEEMAKSLDVDLENDLKILPVKYGSMLLFNNCIPHRSLNNLSGVPGEIRWSMDLRWQNPKENWGYHGLAEGITFRKAEDPSWRPGEEEWDKFLKVPRNTKSQAASTTNNPVADAVLKNTFTLDTTLTGPWMRSWEITNMNRHTARLTK